MNLKKYSTIIILLILAIYIVALIFGEYFTLEALKTGAYNLKSYSDNHLILSIFSYSLLYIVSASLSLPWALPLTLLGGALFGLVGGIIIISFSSSIGALFAFLGSRYFFRDSVEKKFGKKLKTFNTGIRNEGAFYLFTLRLVPILPFFIVNIVMGLTPIKISTYYIVSQLGMLPATAIFANAGTQLSSLDSFAGIISPNIIISFILIGCFPIAAKKLLSLINK